jgi:type IV pilus assembly protein PilA
MTILLGRGMLSPLLFGHLESSGRRLIMMSRLQKRKDEDGFTLIELLVVIIIIGILAAIAIPVFLNQRSNAWDAAVQSDLRNAATAQETYLTSQGVYSQETPAGAELEDVGFKYSGAANYAADPAAITVTAVAGNEYCLQATSAADGGAKIWSYSSPGGLVEGACVA